jgi:hypothetical protein
MTVRKAVVVTVVAPNDKKHRLEARFTVDQHSESMDARMAPETKIVTRRFMEMMPHGVLTVREVAYEGKPVGAKISQMTREFQADQS